MTPFVSKEHDHDAVSDNCLNHIVHLTLTAMGCNRVICLGPGIPNLSISR